MIVAPYVAGRGFDPMLSQIIQSQEYVCTKKDDDWITLCVGGPGSGKSNLGLWVLEEYLGAEASVEWVATSRERFAKGLKAMSTKKGKRFLDYDEVDVTKREAMSRWNRAILKVYGKIRGLRGNHWLNHPYPELIDKPFVEERVKILIVIIDKNEAPRPRHYYLYTKDRLLRLLEKEGNIKTRTLIRNGPEYAYGKGWFREYKGALKAAYLALKEPAMHEAVDEFYEEFGSGELISLQQGADRVGVSYKTFRKYLEQAVEDKAIPENRRRPTGQWRMTEDDLETVRMTIMKAEAERR